MVEIIQRSSEVKLIQGKAQLKYSEIEERLTLSTSFSWVHNVDRKTLHDYKDLFLAACEEFPLTK